MRSDRRGIRAAYLSALACCGYAFGAHGAELELEKEELKLGFIKLTDMAPLAIAYEKGFFEDEGLYVTLEPQANWKVILDRVITGELDGAYARRPAARCDDRFRNEGRCRHGFQHGLERERDYGFKRSLVADEAASAEGFAGQAATPDQGRRSEACDREGQGFGKAFSDGDGLSCLDA